MVLRSTCLETASPEPDNPLFTLDGEAARRLLLTPHIAGVTRQSAAFLFRSAWQNVERVLVKGAAPMIPPYPSRGLFHGHARTFGHRAPSVNVGA